MQASTDPPASSRLLYDSHTHTQFCGHAVGPVEAYAAQALMRNLRGIIFTCHNPLPAPLAASARMEQHEFAAYLQAVARLRTQWGGSLDVRLGLECDYRADLTGYLRELLARQPLDYVLGSIHPHLTLHENSFDPSDFDAYADHYFDLLGEAAESGLFHAMAHLDLIKCLQPHYWELERVFPYVERCLDRIAAAAVAVELNTAGYYRVHSEMHPGPQILAAMCARGIPVVLGSDAHTPDRVGDLFLTALTLLSAAGYEQVSHFIEGQRMEVPIEQARLSLEQVDKAYR